MWKQKAMGTCFLIFGGYVIYYAVTTGMELAFDGLIKTIIVVGLIFSVIGIGMVFRKSIADTSEMGHIRMRHRGDRLLSYQSRRKFK